MIITVALSSAIALCLSLTNLRSVPANPARPASPAAAPR